MSAHKFRLFGNVPRFYNYESSLRDFLHQKWVVEMKKENPMASTDFRNLTLHTKVDILYSLCMGRLDAEDATDAIKVNPRELTLSSL